jgi:hypothetical protein
MRKYDNTTALSDFVKVHQLMNRFSIIQFSAIVTISTANNKITNEPLKVMITFDGYNNCGTLTLLESHIDPNLYPTVFDAKWQKFEHISNEFLLITGNHTQNPTIGNYVVKVLPLGRIRE